MGSVYNQCARLDDTQLYGCFDNAGYQIVQQVHVDQALTAEHDQQGKRLIFRHTTSSGCLSAGYVDYAKKMIFQV